MESTRCLNSTTVCWGEENIWPGEFCNPEMRGQICLMGMPPLPPGREKHKCNLKFTRSGFCSNEESGHLASFSRKSKHWLLGGIDFFDLADDAERFAGIVI